MEKERKPKIDFISWNSLGGFVVLINGKRYEYTGVSEYMNRQLQYYIEKNNYKTLFAALKHFTKEGVTDASVGQKEC